MIRPAVLASSVTLLGLGLLASDRVDEGAGQMADMAYRVARTEAEAASLMAGRAVAWAAAMPIRWGPPRYATEFRALWNDTGLFVRFESTDTNPWYTMTGRDDRLWEEEVVEIFLDLDGSGHDYAEVEISPGNVVCDLRMVRPWPNQEGDLTWDLEGLETRVRTRLQRDGTTAGWTATAYMPWSGFASLPSAADVQLPPRAGDHWRFNVFRIKRPRGPERPNDDVSFLAWSEPRGSSFHDAEVFRPFVFEGTP